MPTTAFLDMFARSPIRPLEAHMSKAHACVAELEPFFAAVFAQDWQEASLRQQVIANLEHEADNIKRELRKHFPNSLFMTVSRSDLLDLLYVQDRLANKAEDIAGVVLGRKMIFPPTCVATFLTFLQRAIDASKQANLAIHELDELLETSFSGKDVKHVDEMIATLSQIENETDEQQVHLREAIFALEDTLPPIHVIFLYKVIKWTGDLADQAREIGDRLQILLAK